MKKTNNQTKTVKRVCWKKKKSVKTAEQKENDTKNATDVLNTENL